MTASPAPSRPRLVIVDAANCIYRAFFALPPLRSSSGEPTNAALGFVNMVNKVVREEQPDYVAVAFDPRGKSFRHEVFSEYKATREAQPEALTSQFPLVRDLVEAYRLPILEVEGFEADDVIATLVEEAPADLEICILSTDKDLMQLVSDRVVLLDTMKDRRYDAAEVEKRFGVLPALLLDLRALVGDPSDNIPGVKGIGEKGAAKLIHEWGGLDRLLENASQVKAKRAREALVSQADRALLSRELATLRRDVPLPLSLDGLRFQEPDVERLRELFTRLEFSRLLEGLDEAEGVAPRKQAAPIDLEVIGDCDSLEKWVASLEGAERLVLAVIGERDEPMRDRPVGFAVAADGQRAAYLPVGHQDLVAPSLPLEDVLDALRRVLTGPPAPRIACRAYKYAHVLLGERGIDLARAAFDVDLAGFLLDPSAQRTTSVLASKHLDRSVAGWEDVAGRGVKAVAAPELSVEVVSGWAGETVCAHHALEPKLRKRLENDELLPLFEEIELPLLSVLARMERAGVRIDEEKLLELSEEYAGKLAGIETEIYQLAGEEFQIASPKQLQRILFEKLELPVLKKTKTGYSTAEAVLEQLSAHHELPAKIVAHRHLSKLKSTYIDALPPLVNPTTGRIHPTFHPTGAATGRLSCTNPNLQNIPIRTPEGVRIREAFIPAEGCVLVSADYSQVELRVLAHFSGDTSLIEAFRVGDDIHRRTAAEVRGLTPDQVSDEERARAKAVNFGIIYGLSAFGLSQQLGIPPAEAQQTIDAYFQRYGGVRKFLDETIAAAKQKGFVRTLLGRRRYLPDLASRNRVLRQAAERMAVNTVIQGTAADLMKKAMVAVDAALADGGFASRMLLQVHDELLLDVPTDEVEAVGTLVRGCMEQIQPLDVPFQVDLGVGASWREAH